MVKEKRFYNALKGIFEGVKMDGQGGFVNLLRIKEKYYKSVIDEFKNEVDHDSIIDADFKEEFFDKLCNFFDKYFSESGSIYFVQSANWQKVYEKIYTDNKDVVLFWKTNMLYYVKSDKLLNTTDIKVEDKDAGLSYVFRFDTTQATQKQNNEKKGFLYTVKEILKTKTSLHDATSGDVTFVLSVDYESRSKTKVEELSKELNVNEDIISKAIRQFEKQTSVDFFINKNAKQFLNEQLDLYLNQILLADENVFDQKRLDQIKVIKKYAQKLIQFISGFEDELVRIWNKPKFVKNSNYVISKDKLTTDLISKLKANTGFEDQIKEWKKLKLVEDNFSVESLNDDKYKHLPFDSKYFKDLEIEILSIFDNLDNALDGRLIHSENYQALNSLTNKFKNNIYSVYIDPPFNTGSDFEYVDAYQDSSWLSLMYDRLDLSYNLLNPEGSIFMHLDHFAEHKGRELLDSIFGKENFINNIAWAYRSGGASDSKTMPYKHDSILFYSKNKDKFILNPITERQYMEKSFMGAQKDAEGRYYTDTLLRDVFEGVIKDPNTNIEYNVRKVLNLSDEFFSFSNSQKPEGLIHLLESLVNIPENKYFIDYFAGSGTSICVAKKMGRKFIGVELGDHFNNTYISEVKLKQSPANQINLYKDFDVIQKEENDKYIIAKVNKVGLLGRMKEVISQTGRHEPCGITVPTKFSGGGFFKYFELEQYEDTLRNANYSPNSPSLFNDNIYDQYTFFADKKLTSNFSVENNGDIKIELDKLYKNIDLPETISNVMGLPIKSITKDAVILLDGEKEIIEKYDYQNMTNKEKQHFFDILKSLLWWGE